MTLFPDWVQSLIVVVLLAELIILAWWGVEYMWNRFWDWQFNRRYKK